MAQPDVLQFKRFTKAVELVQNLPKDPALQPTNNEKLRFYGLYKQATKGNCDVPRPAFYDVTGKAKWEAWNAFRDLLAGEAMDAYVDTLTNYLSRFKDRPMAQDIIQRLNAEVSPKDSSNGLSALSTNAPALNGSTNNGREDKPPSPGMPTPRRSSTSSHTTTASFTPENSPSRSATPDEALSLSSPPSAQAVVAAAAGNLAASSTLPTSVGFSSTAHASSAFATSSSGASASHQQPGGSFVVTRIPLGEATAVTSETARRVAEDALRRVSDMEKRMARMEASIPPVPTASSSSAISRSNTSGLRGWVKGWMRSRSMIVNIVVMAVVYLIARKGWIQRFRDVIGI